MNRNRSLALDPRSALRPVAWAAGALVSAMFFMAADRAHAQEQAQAEPQATSANDAGDSTELLPTKDPCGTCDRPLAQATGAVAPQSLPAPPRPTGATFKLNDLRLNGVKALTNEELQTITGPYIGRDVTLTDLEELAKAITARYKERGYFLAQAVVPVQTVRDGIVEISVIEGRLGKVDVVVAPDAPIAESRVRGFLAPLQPGEAVSAPAYERAMLLLSDQPGVKVSSGLQEGAQAGTTDLSVEVAAAPRWAFTAEADNHGTKESGRYRVGGTARWLSPFGIGDNLDMRVMVSDSNALQYGRIAYEAPIGTSGLRAGVGLSRVSYELGGQFVDLDARGRANVLDFSLNYPLIRQRQQNLFLRLGVDVKDLTDELRAADFSSKKRVNGLSLGWTWERRDDLLGGGYWASSGTLYHGNLSIRDPESRDFDRSITGHNTEGGFTKLSFQLSRLQAIVPRHSLYLSVGGQWASKNLDASEKLALGGARAVRAYPSGELLVDQGVIGTVEWRWSLNEELTPFLFYDAAHGKIVRNPTPYDGINSHSLRGYGVGLSWSRPGNFSINATLAWRAGTPPALTDGGGRNPRLYVQLIKAF
ncbi:ShlB/FhaC/HecB family hemolysin secretion/activation protein [Variovorax paradoxus]|uniref:ShlB/FhaC/HecB family hemolysin secretion/activation protein n=1 Tax=Variovorax paradoxus TaxID=34073 RepID=UPI0021AD4E49|nr:ShlB/FhaC/HecB family hemolysin secretion/activation protein [Variovorax paradoxus]UVH56816.1 ShlB/FhaC/HecB family hemolysin secretion/activation protein [Variovorax paradoxus]